MTAIAVAGALLAFGFADRAMAHASSLAGPQTQAVAARAHLSYKPAVREGAFEGAITVVEQRTALAAADPSPAGLSTEAAGPMPQLSPLAVRYLIYTQTSEGSGLAQGSLRQTWPRCALADLVGSPPV